MALSDDLRTVPSLSPDVPPAAVGVHAAPAAPSSCPTGPTVHPPPAPGAARGPMDWMAMLFVAAFAFLLASFPERNGDAWVHLAAGRNLAHGDFVFGQDPRLFPARAVSRSWLFDLLVFGAYSAWGGPGLVFGKALLASGLALLLLRLSRARSGWRPAVACTALALLAMGTRLLLQPATLSCLFLALTLWLLRPRGESDADRPAPPVPPPWPLLVLFLVWANMDGWFVVGLATVGLVWQGRILDFAVQKSQEPGGRGAKSFFDLLMPLYPRFLASLAILGAACLVNPSHVYAFASFPELLGESGAGSSASSAVRGAVTSPFLGGYFATVGFSPASLAYFPLLGLGLVSFLLNLPRWPWRRFLPWVGLALLSALQARAVPFFAAAAAPATAWNLGEFFARRSDARRSVGRAGRIAGRLAAAALGLAFLACAWPGWLQAPPFEPRRWGVEAPPALQGGAAAIRQLRTDGTLGPDARAVYLSAETDKAFAWFCPEEQGVLDERLASALLGDPGAVDWARRMRAAGANHLIVYEPDRGRLLPILNQLMADPEQWPLLYEEGDLAVFGWRDPDRAGTEDAFRGRELDLNRLAFHPAEGRQAPRKPSDRGPEERAWTDAFWKAAPPHPIDHDEATLDLFQAEALRRPIADEQRRGWYGSQTAALFGAAAGWAGPADGVAQLDARVRLAMALTPPPQQSFALDAVPVPERWAIIFQRAYALQQDDVPPALLYLAVRAARRALAVNPNDAQAYLVLGESYLRLLHGTRERVWGNALPQIVQLRYAQASAALNQAVSLKPDLAQAHLSLYRLYMETGCFDLALDHLQTYDKLAHATGDPAEVPAEEIKALAKEVQGRNNAYTLQSNGLRVVDRALVAMDRGLAGKARDLLLESDVSAFGKAGATLELGLLLATGRPRDVIAWTGPEQQALLEDPVAYHWLRAQATAATGNYALAEEECAAMAPSLGLGDSAPEGMTSREEMAVLVGRRVLSECPGPGPPYALWWPYGRPEFQDGMTRLSRQLRDEANVAVVWGLLALEQGDVGDATFAFHKALGVWRDEATAASGGGLDFEGRVIAQAWLRRLESAAAP